MAQVWDMREDESSLQYKAFECYVELDPRVRNLDNAWLRYKEHNDKATGEKPSSAFHQWCQRFEWVARAKAYDAHLATQRRKGLEAGVRQEAKRQAASVEKLRGQLYENFDAIQNTVELFMGKVEELDTDKITLPGIANLLRIQLDIAKHLSDDTKGQTPEEELDKMSEEDLAKEISKWSEPGGTQGSD